MQSSLGIIREKRDYKELAKITLEEHYKINIHSIYVFLANNKWFTELKIIFRVAFFVNYPFHIIPSKTVVQDETQLETFFTSYLDKLSESTQEIIHLLS